MIGGAYHEYVNLLSYGKILAKIIQQEVSEVDGLEIVRARRDAGVDQRDLALALDLSSQRLSDMERGYVSIPRGFDKRVRAALRQVLREWLKTVAER